MILFLGYRLQMSLLSIDVIAAVVKVPHIGRGAIYFIHLISALAVIIFYVYDRLCSVCTYHEALLSVYFMH